MLPDMDDRNHDPVRPEQLTQRLEPVRAPRRPGHAARWAIAIAIAIGTAAVIIGGGAAVLAVSGGGGTSSRAGQAGVADSARQPGQAVQGSKAELNTVLSAADSPTAADLAAASPTPAGAHPGHRAAARGCRRLARRLHATAHPRAAHRVRAACRAGRRAGRARLRPLVRGIHGQFTYRTKHGVKTLAFERGTIQQVAGTAVTVRAPDGTTWTWQVVGDTVVRQDRAKVGAASLAAGQRVFVGGPVVSGVDDARLIVIRPAAPSASASAPAPAS
jgi:hypothetical protein